MNSKRPIGRKDESMIEAMTQLAALCAHGNAFLSGRSSTLEELNELACMQSVDSYSFERAVPGYRGGSIASMPSAWLRRLQSEDVSMLRFCFEKFDYRFPSRAPKAGAFAGLLIEGSAGIELWTPEWTFRGNRNDGKNWRVAYVSQRVGRHLFNPPPSLDAANASWSKALTTMTASFERAGSKIWKSRFESLLALSEKNNGLPGRFEGIVPKLGSSKAARASFADTIRTQIILNSTEYAEQSECGQWDAAILDGEKALWRATGSLLESALFAQSRALEAAA